MLILIGIKAKENPRVIVYISSVSSEIMKEDIENYFEAQGDNIQVQSAKFLRAEEKVIVELVGITAKGASFSPCILYNYMLQFVFVYGCRTNKIAG